MEITPQIKERVVQCLLSDKEQRKFSSFKKHAIYVSQILGIPFDDAAYSQIKSVKGRDGVITNQSWLKLARHYKCLDQSRWNSAETHVYRTVTTALEYCRNGGIWQVLCDNAGMGKSYAALQFVQQHKDSVIYIDCSDCGSKSDFITEVANSLGIPKASTFSKLWRDCVDFMLLMDKPLLILDEFGDVAEGVITLMKGLYNKADLGDRMALGCYFIGADNLRFRLDNGRKRCKQSYAEFWSRFNSQLTTLNIPRVASSYEECLKRDIALIVDTNITSDIAHKRSEIIDNCVKTMGVRSVRKEILKHIAIYEFTKSLF